MFKNVAAKFMVFAFDATTNVPKTGDAANITAYVSKDYGTVTVLADTSATEMDATNAPGYYLFDAAQGETNGDCLMVSGKSSTANIKILGAPAVIYTRPTTGWLAPTVATRTLDVSATGEAGVDWGNVGSPTTANALTNTSIITTQKVDVDTIKTNPVVNAGTVTFPTNATLASTTNITAGTIATVTTVTNQLTAAAIATGVWTDTVAGDFTTALSVGKSLMNGVTLGTGLTVANLTNAPTSGDFTATMKTSAQTAVDAAITANALVLEIEADTDTLTGFITAAPPTSAAIATAVFTTQLTESYAAVHVVPTLAQAIFEVRGLLAEASVATTTLTVKKVDGTTSAKTYTLSSSTAPTSITNAS